jgi:hypothetical protein
MKADNNKIFDTKKLEKLPYNYFFLHQNDETETPKQDKRFRFSSLKAINSDSVLVEPFYKSISRLFNPEDEK